MPVCPHLHFSGGKDAQNQVKPNVGKDTPSCRDEKHAQVFNFARLSVRNHVNAQSDDDEHVEGGASDDGARTQRTGLETVSTDLRVEFELGHEASLNDKIMPGTCGTNLDHGQQDLWSAGTQSHQSEIRNGLVPDSDCGSCRLAVGLLDGDLLLLGCYDLHRKATKANYCEFLDDYKAIIP